MRSSFGVAVRGSALIKILGAGLVVIPVLVLTGLAQASWTQYRGNGQRDARAQWSGPTARPIVAWQRTIGQWNGEGEPPMYRSSPIVGQFGTVYVGAGRAYRVGPAGPVAHLYAFSADGRRVWSSRLNGYGVYSAPALGRDGRMLVIGQRFDAKRGPMQRAFVVTEAGRVVGADAIEREGGSSPLVDYDGNFFYRDPTGLWVLRRLDHRTSFQPTLVASNLGDLTSSSGVYDALSDFFDSLQDIASCFPGCDFDSTVTLPPPPYTNAGAALPAPAWSGPCRDVAVALWDRFYRFNRGGLLANVDADALATPAIGRRGVVTYVSLKHQKLAAVTQGGRVLWRLGWGHQPVNLAVGELGLTPGLGLCRSVDADGRATTITTRRRDVVYVRDADGGLAAINGDTGYPLWYKNNARLVGEPVVLANRSGQVVVAAGERALYGFRGSDGQQIWSLPLDSPALGSPAVANGRIYVATYRSLYAIELQ
jgi:outer membrane protein assembly factor BamB